MKCNTIGNDDYEPNWLMLWPSYSKIAKSVFCVCVCVCVSRCELIMTSSLLLKKKWNDIFMKGGVEGLKA